MPITKVEAPDGSIIKVEHPEGASQDDIIRFAQSQYRPREFSQMQEPAEIAEPQGGTIADSLGKGLTFGFADELAGVAGAGVNSIANIFGKGTGDTFGEAYRGIRDAARGNEQAFAERNPATAFGAEMVGGLATGGVGAARAGAFRAARSAPTLLGRVAPAVQTGLVQGAVAGAGLSEKDTIGGVAGDTLQGAAIGGIAAPILPAIGGAAKQSASRVFATASDSPTFKKALSILEDVPGFKPTTGQRTGSRQLKATEGTLAETLLGGNINRAITRNRQVVQEKMMRMAGFNADDAAAGEITADAIEAAQEKLSAKYANLTKDKIVDFETDRFVDALYDVAAKNTRMVEPLQVKKVNSIVDSVFDMVTERPMTGEVYQAHRSELGRLAQQNANRPAIADLYRSLKNALDDEFARASGVNRKPLDKVYSRFALLRDTFQRNGGAGVSQGELPMASVLRAAKKNSTDKEFADLVGAFQTVLADSVPNSGTASRALNLMQMTGSGAALGADPTMGAASVGLPLSLNVALSRGVTGNSLVNGLTNAGLSGLPAFGANRVFNDIDIEQRPEPRRP